MVWVSLLILFLSVSSLVTCLSPEAHDGLRLLWFSKYRVANPCSQLSYLVLYSRLSLSKVCHPFITYNPYSASDGALVGVNLGAVVGVLVDALLGAVLGAFVGALVGTSVVPIQGVHIALAGTLVVHTYWVVYCRGIWYSWIPIAGMYCTVERHEVNLRRVGSHPCDNSRYCSYEPYAREEL